MAQIQRRNLYQPQNVSQGFNPVKAADITPSLRRNEQQRQRNQKQIDKAAAQDLKTKEANLELDAIEADRDLNALLAFAPTAQGLLEDAAKNRIAQKKADATQWVASQQEERAKIVAEQSHLTQQLREGSIDNEKYKEELARIGAPFNLIDEANKFNSWDQYWRVHEAVKNLNEDEYDKSIREQFTSDEELINGKSWNSPDLDPDEHAYGLRVAENRFLVANNLNQRTTLGLQMTVGQPIRDKINTEFADAHSKNYYINESHKYALLKKGQAFELKDAASVSAYLNAEARKLKSDGKTMNGFTAAHDNLFKSLLELSKRPEGVLQANEILKAYGEVTLNGKPFSILHADRINNFKAQHVANIKTGAGAVRDMMVEQATEEAKQLIDTTLEQSGGNLSRAGALALKKGALDIFEAAGVKGSFDSKQLGLDDVFLNLTTTGQALKDLEVEVKYRITHGTFNEEYFATLPKELQEVYANKLVSTKFEKSEEGKAVLSSLHGYIFGNHRVKTSQAADKAAFGDVLRVDIERKVANLAERDQNSSSPKFNSYAEAYTHFMKNEIDEIKLGIDDPTSIYYHGNDGYMNYIENKIGKMEDVTAARRHKIRTFYATYKTIGQGVWESPNSVASDDGLRDLKQRIEQGDTPQYVKDMNRVTGGNLIKNVNKQLALAGIDPIEMFTELPPMSPRVEAIINKTLDGSISHVQALRETYAFRGVRPRAQEQGMPMLVAQNLGGEDPSGFASRPVRQRGEYLFNYMTKDLGMSDIHAMGLLANAMRESTFTTTIAGDNGLSNGMFQWHKTRLDSARRALGNNWDDPRAQIRYALEEPGEPGQEYLRMTFSSAQQAADWWAKYWERPADLKRDSDVHAGFISRWNQGGV